MGATRDSRTIQRGLTENTQWIHTGLQRIHKVFAEDSQKTHRVQRAHKGLTEDPQRTDRGIHKRFTEHQHRTHGQRTQAGLEEEPQRTHRALTEYPQDSRSTRRGLKYCAGSYMTIHDPHSVLGVGVKRMV